MWPGSPIGVSHGEAPKSDLGGRSSQCEELVERDQLGVTKSNGGRTVLFPAEGLS